MSRPTASGPLPEALWRSSEGTLVSVGPPSGWIPGALPLHADPDQGITRTPSNFRLIDSEGRVAASYESQMWSIEDELAGKAYLVENGELLEISVSQVYRRPAIVEQRAVLTSLVPVLTSAHGEFDRANEALIRARQEREREADQRTAEGEARLARIPGAREAYSLGDAFARAQSLLCAAVVAGADSLDEALLSTLVQIGRLYALAEEPDESFIAWSAAPFALACRQVVNDSTVSAERGAEEGAAEEIARWIRFPSKLRTPLASVIDGLRHAREQLELHAGWTEYNDARFRGMTLREAARQVEISLERFQSLARER